MQNKIGPLAWLAALIIGIILFLRFRASAAVTEIVAPVSENNFTSPYFYPNGIYPQYIPPESTVNIYVDNPLGGSLGRQFFPIFGFVGMTAVNS